MRRVGRGHAVRRFRAFAPDRVPVAEIGPGAAQRRHAQIARALHHGAVDGDGPDRFPGLGVETDESEIRRGGLHRGADRRHQIGRMRLERGDEIRRAAEKHARVPQRAVIRDQRTRRLRVGLLDEARHPARAARGTALPARRVGHEITVSGFRPVRRHAEGHEIAASDRLHARGDRPPERRRIGDQMVRGRHEHHRVRILRRHMQRRRQHRRRRVARRGLEEHVRLAHAGVRELLQRHEAERGARHHHRRRERRAGKPLRALPEQAPPAHDRGELFGMPRPRDRPEAGAGAAAENHRADGMGHFRRTLLFGLAAAGEA